MPVIPGQDSIAGYPADALLERRFELADEAATDAFGARFAKAIAEQRQAARRDGLQVQLTGDLGAGKTSLVRATLRALGHAGRVRSPTYTLVEPYTVATPDGELALYHFDLYRFGDPSEWTDAGFREYLDSGAVCLVEWPQRASGLLGVPDLAFALEPGERGEGRVLTAFAYSNLGKACLERC
ncbi:tRNA (adenosine(37)-N6)-threonylcarbamoyltransferase complex ATPase subunit type 1 TsaE [Burkholderia sp. WAC0059]|uniref:tRNA (adenosine(37)-N6)-threonylcarbamoyltransferase complex ATPase subunit type 1 TsaE n=1 Tax=Burkholderia sp. WAC0059 TaxID=2066022 RepID=UPI000C7EB09A|nr:tRNA (adenosine(37)-N6)-threonylcarbamoyltransferase complex ATPase subunit type 1 TsaE [Burkholderia sp. WAC0059]PLZ03254.1 tRNA (adenosine(37)-N6)-threonylcarbamoyltransferase complex ATPase subunit type 1 TsaE [Burkholderia sp. WAC0059]